MDNVVFVPLCTALCCNAKCDQHAWGSDVKNIRKPLQGCVLWPALQYSSVNTKQLKGNIQTDLEQIIRFGNKYNNPGVKTALWLSTGLFLINVLTQSKPKTVYFKGHLNLIGWQYGVNTVCLHYWQTTQKLKCRHKSVSNSKVHQMK